MRASGRTDPGLKAANRAWVRDLCRVAASPYPAYKNCKPGMGAGLVPGGGFALPGLENPVGPCKRSAAGHFSMLSTNSAPSGNR